MRISPKVCSCGRPPLIKRDRLEWVFTVYCSNPQCSTPAVSRTSKDSAITTWNDMRRPRSFSISIEELFLKENPIERHCLQQA